MNDDINAWIKDLRHAADLAALHYEVWWLYKGSRPVHVRIMNDYNMFFRASIQAHFLGVLVPLYRLYETRPDTYNIPKLINSSLLDGHLNNKEMLLIRKIHQNNQTKWTKVSILRNEAFGHRKKNLTVEQAFKKAQITPNDLKQLIKNTHRLLDIITKEKTRGLGFLSTETKKDAEKFLGDLKTYSKLKGKVGKLLQL